MEPSFTIDASTGATFSQQLHRDFKLSVVAGSPELERTNKLGQEMLTLNLKGEVSVRLTSLYLLVMNQLFQDKLIIFFHFQNNLVLTGKDEEVNRNDTSPSNI